MPTAVVSGPTVAIQPATKQCGQNPRPTQLLNLLADDGLPDSAGKIVSVMAENPALDFSPNTTQQVTQRQRQS